MAASELRRTTASVVFKKTASIATAISFLAAAVFLVGVLWTPANAASSSAEVDVQPTLLLALDKPQPPAPKLRLASLTQDLKEIPDDLPSPELATELNNWTFTANNSVGLGLFLYTGVLQFQTNVILHGLFVELTFLKAFLQFEAGLFQQLLGQVPAFLTMDINAISAAQNALSPWR
jgi:hypothetical protein